MYFLLFYVFLCSFYCLFCDVSLLFVCICVLKNCHRVATQLQINIYRIISKSGLGLCLTAGFGLDTKGISLSALRLPVTTEFCSMFGILGTCTRSGVDGEGGRKNGTNYRGSVTHCFAHVFGFRCSISFN